MSTAIPKNFSRISRNWVSKLWSPKILSSLGPIMGNFSRISLESVTEMILEKFLRNSSKKVTTFRESREIRHFCYLGRVLKVPYRLSENVLSRKIYKYKVVISDDQV